MNPIIWNKKKIFSLLHSKKTTNWKQKTNEKSLSRIYGSSTTKSIITDPVILLVVEEL